MRFESNIYNFGGGSPYYGSTMSLNRGVGRLQHQPTELEAVGLETASLFARAFDIGHPGPGPVYEASLHATSLKRKRSRISLVRRISSLFSGSGRRVSQDIEYGGPTCQVSCSGRTPVEGGASGRSYSVSADDRGGGRGVSRRQILASLEEGIREEIGEEGAREDFGDIAPVHGMFSRSMLLRSITMQEEDVQLEEQKIRMEESEPSSSEDSDGDQPMVSRESSVEDSSSGAVDKEEAKQAGKDSSLLHQETFVVDRETEPVATSMLGDTDNVKQLYRSVSAPVSSLELSDLNWIATLGVGGFGRVELVTVDNNGNNESFALKKMRKSDIGDAKQQQHILNEKSIMETCDSSFIVRLHKTFKDKRYLYMLMEPCLGGELWTILRNHKRFDDATTKFYTACVIEAFDYLHAKNIIYRDLKPENLLLDASGYVKLVDFGFAKQLDREGRAWTFCGTPEYVAPEIITNKSHDQRADIWSLGVLMYELLTGRPPFTASPSQGPVYPIILKGMKAVTFPPVLGTSAKELIRQLCRLNPAQRPNLKVMRHYMWFAGFDWLALRERRMKVPLVPKVSGETDASNFDIYSKEVGEAVEDLSDWDKDF